MRRRGFTLVELLAAMTLFLALIAFALPSFTAQARAVDATSARHESRMGLRFAMSQLDRDLRMAGAGTFAEQPVIVLADGRAIVITGNLASPDSLDPSAVNVDPDADPGSTSSLRPTDGYRLPVVDRAWPDTTYARGGLRSPAETISWFVTPDSATPAADDFVLWRQENALPPAVMATGIVLAAGEGIFTYLRPNAAGRLTAIDAARLPLRHVAPLHGSAADTGAGSAVDSIRSVSIRLVAAVRDARTGVRRDSLRGLVRIANAGLAGIAVCGEAPVFGSAVTATLDVATASVTVTWSAATDEASGERDVEQYAVFRRPLGGLGFGDPIGSVAGGRSSYAFTDATPPTGAWVYGVAAIDCTPTASPVAQSATVTVP